MELTNSDLDFLVKRARLVRSWSYVGIFIISFLILFSGWLFMTKPLLANPFFVLSSLNDNSIALPTLHFMAVLLPVFFLMSIFITILAVVFAFVSFSNEKRYLKIIQKMKEER